MCYHLGSILGHASPSITFATCPPVTAYLHRYYPTADIPTF